MAKKIILKGVVQGVCCRQFCSQYARKYKIRGSATNLSDGSVRLLIDTDDVDLIKEYLYSIQNNPSGISFYGRIDDIEINDYSGPIHGDYIF